MLAFVLILFWAGRDNMCDREKMKLGRYESRKEYLETSQEKEKTMIKIDCMKMFYIFI